MSLSTKKLLAIIFLMFFISRISMVYARSVEKQAVLAVLTLNIARFTSWPEEVFDWNKPTINLCVIGDNVVQESFEGMREKKINGKILHILNRSRLRNLSECHLIFISDLKRNVLVQVLLDLKDQPVLTVGEGLQFLQSGGMVALEKQDVKMQLNVNLPIVKQSRLVVSSRILKLAKIFEFSYPGE